MAAQSSLAGAIAVTVVAGILAFLYCRRRSERRQVRTDLNATRDGARKRQDGPEGAFQDAVDWVGSSGSSLSMRVKLELYGWFKQATVGDAPAKAPVGIEANMKWKAWSEHTGVKTGEAKSAYVGVLTKAVPSWRQGGETAEVDAEEDAEEDPEDRLNKATGPTVSLLGQLGDPEDVDASPEGRLNELIAKGEAASVRLMLEEHGPELAFRRDKDGMTSIHWAADRDRGELLQELLALASARPDAADCVNARDEAGSTALHFAVMAENFEVARLLVAARADPGVEDEEGETPLSLAGDSKAWREVFAQGVSG